MSKAIKPHTMRRGFWLLNLALIAGVGYLGYQFFTKTRPAVASVINRKSKKLPKPYQKQVNAYARASKSLDWKPRPPVMNAELEKVILRKDYEERNHWIFSGPMPPKDKPEVISDPVKPKGPRGLAAIGRVVMATYIPGNHSIVFRFGKGGPPAATKSAPGKAPKAPPGNTGTFTQGEFIRETPEAAKRFKFIDLVRVNDKLGVFNVVYDVHDTSSGERVEERKMYLYDTNPPDDDSGIIVFAGDAAKRAAAKVAAEGQNGEGTAGEGGTGEAGEGETTEAVSETPTDVGTTKPVESDTYVVADLRPQDLRPKRHNLVGGRKGIAFDKRTFDYFRGKNAKKVAESIKTEIARDPKTGTTLGLRFTGFGKDSPADVFDVKRGDILVSINGQRVASRADVMGLIDRLKNAKTVEVVLDRLGKRVTYMVDPSDPRTRREARYLTQFAEQE